MNLLPIFGFLAGLVIRRPLAFFITAAAALIGFSLAAWRTDEIDGWHDPYVWVLTVISFLATWLGLWVGIRLTRRRHRSA